MVNEFPCHGLPLCVLPIALVAFMSLLLLIVVTVMCATIDIYGATVGGWGVAKDAVS